MKLTAPPPPPPEPNEPDSENNQTPGETPDQTTPPVVTPTEPPAAAPPAEPRIVTWPAWFAGADFVLATLALVLAFLVASFAARNTDLWLHLAAGKRLFAGEYRPGNDPFSYAAADRTWVNHSLLFDAASYLLYSGDGAVLVVVKAVAIALAFGLVIGIRKPGFSLWPWASVAVVAIIAAAPRLVMSPLIGSMLLLAVTLWLLFRMPHTRGSWRFPIAIGITFWLWANVDGWFILGPFALGLVLLGELLQSRFRKPADGSIVDSTDGNAAEPLGPLPDVPTLAKALGIGLIVCMLNPHHIRIWELPFELTGATMAELDPRIRQSMLLTPLDKIYTDNSGLGYNLNGLCYAVLFVGGGVVLGFGVGRVRIAHIALWLGFAVLSLMSTIVIPFFALVAVPLVAAQLNAFSKRARLKHWDDPVTKLLLFGSAGGRVVCAIAVIAACVVAWPGWMHPDPYNTAFARRVEWKVEPDAGMVRAAEQLQSWRAAGQLPPEAKGIILSVELANHCAWFAPLEKVYINGNYAHHRAELSNYVKMRRDLGLYSTETPTLATDLPELLQSINPQYVVLHAGQGDSAQSRRAMQSAAADQLWLDADHWSPWYLDGRSTVVGWRSAPGAESPSFKALHIDTVALAFGPNVERLPADTVKPIPPAEGWEGEFLHGNPLSPPGADEAFGWYYYKDGITKVQTMRDVIALGLLGLTPSPTHKSFHQLIMRLSGVPSRRTAADVQAGNAAASIPLIAFRAARRAIAAAPDHPDGYFALYLVLSDPELPLTPAERAISQVTALRQCVYRLPPPNRFRRGVYLASPTIVAQKLAEMYLGGQESQGRTGVPVDLPSLGVLQSTPLSGDGLLYLVDDNRTIRVLHQWQLSPTRPVQRVGGPYLRAVDLAHQALVLADEYGRVELTPLGDMGKRQQEVLKLMLKSTEEQLVQGNKAYEQDKLSRGQMKVLDQIRAALRHNMVGEALKLLTDRDTDLTREFGPELERVLLVRVGLELATGRLEDAAADLDVLPASLPPSSRTPGDPNYLNNMLQNLRYQKMIFEGNFKGAGEIIEGAARGIEQEAKYPPADKKTRDLSLMGSPFTLVQIAELAPVFPIVALHRDIMLRESVRPYQLRQQEMMQQRTAYLEFFYRRGLLSLFEGDIPTARTRFRQTRQPAIPDWGISAQGSSGAERYLRLIEEADKTAK